MDSLIFLPLEYFFCERKLAEALPKQRRQFVRQFGTIKLFRRFAFVFIRGFALYEQALDRIQRRQLVMPAGQRRNLWLNAKKFANKGIEMRRKRQEQFRFALLG